MKFLDLNRQIKVIYISVLIKIKKIRQKLKIAKQLSESKEDIYQTIQEIGNSGFVEDVMYSSIYSALKGSSFEESILISANGGGAE